MTVHICSDGALWNSYVDAQPAAVCYHRWNWRTAIADSFAHTPYYLMALENDRICGILPLFLIKSRLFGNSLISMPFFSYGGVLAESAAACTALLQHARKVALETRSRRIELRASLGPQTGWCEVSSKVTMQVDVTPPTEEIFNRLNPKLRKRIRYARKNGLTGQWLRGEGVDEFYQIFAVNMRNLGTPVYPRKWFQALCRCAADDIHIFNVFDEGRPAASAFLCRFRDTLEMPWAASLPESRKKFSPLFMYWSILEWAQQNGFRMVDLGRCTPGSGNYEFKSHWATQEQPLRWSYWLADGEDIPHLRPDNPRFRAAVEIWKRLPLFVANGLGPLVVRSLP